jgi:hypothetical protein
MFSFFPAPPLSTELRRRSSTSLVPTSDATTQQPLALRAQSPSLPALRSESCAIRPYTIPGFVPSPSCYMRRRDRSSVSRLGRQCLHGQGSDGERQHIRRRRRRLVQGTATSCASTQPDLILFAGLPNLCGDQRRDLHLVPCAE